MLAKLPEQGADDSPRNLITEVLLRSCGELRKLQRLGPFVAESILTVRGRLRNVVVPFERKFPILLSYQHLVTDLIIAHHHVNEGHIGVGHVLAPVNQPY